MPVPSFGYMILWAVALVALIALEAATANLVSIWFAVGALAALITSLFTPSLLIQCLVFAIVSAAALAASKPFIDKARRQKPTSPVGLDRNIGRRATVISPIAPNEPGRVRLDGIDWIADCDTPLQPGAACTVLSINSNTLKVAPAGEEEAVQ